MAAKNSAAEPREVAAVQGFANRHAGQRCFILATGASINSQDLKPLQGEICIAVSNFHLHPDYLHIRPRYHCIAPFHAPITEAAWQERLSELSAQTGDSVLFFGASDRERNARHPRLQANRQFYLDFTGSWERVRQTGLELGAPLPPAQSVSVMALMVALGMGFSRIYLLGCDHDWIYNLNRGRHFYEERQDPMVRAGYNEWSDTADLEVTFSSYLALWRQYKFLRSIARGRSVDIVNATEGGLLDLFPRVPLTQLVDRVPDPPTKPQASSLPLKDVKDMMQAAVALSREGKKVKALKLVEKIADGSGSLPGVHYLRCLCLNAVGRHQEALEAAKAELLINPGHEGARRQVDELARAIEKKEPVRIPNGKRSWKSALPPETLDSLERSHHNYSYKGVPMLKNPFDFALYPLLLWNLKPRTIVEIGSKNGGSAIWLGDLMDCFGIDGHVYSVDIVKVETVDHHRVSFMEGNGQELGDLFSSDWAATLPRPLLVIEDADHSYETSKAVLEFFHPILSEGEYIVVEDGIISDLARDESCSSGPHRALKDFLARFTSFYEIDAEYCDFFGYNHTWNTNGFLKKVRDSHPVAKASPRRSDPGPSTVRPTSRVFGLDRGMPIDRYYIERFLTVHKHWIQGDVLEVGDSAYTRKFGARVRRSEVLSLAPSNGCTLVGDLATGEHIPESAYDCIILIQTLQMIYDVKSALGNAVKALKPGGVLLLSASGISQISRYDMDRWGEYWRFTDKSLRALLAEFLPAEDIHVEAHGNVAAAKAFLEGFAAHELPTAVIDAHDPDYQVMLTAKAVKPLGAQKTAPPPCALRSVAHVLPTPLILLYHRVVDDPVDAHLLSVSPRRFEEQMQQLASRFRVVGLPQLVDELRAGRMEPDTVAVTFDDGYADNCTLALPILEKHGVPATVFVTSGHIGSSRSFWWDEIESLLLKQTVVPKSLSLEHGRRGRLSLELSSRAQRLAAHDTICALLRSEPAKSIETFLAGCLQWRSTAHPSQNPHRVMNAAQLTRMASSALIEIGSHGVTHSRLACLTLDEQSREITDSKRDLEAVTGKPVRFFSYPFGGAGDMTAETVQCVSMTGYEAGISNIQGLVKAPVQLYALPRRLVRNWSGTEFMDWIAHPEDTHFEQDMVRARTLRILRSEAPAPADTR